MTTDLLMTADQINLEIEKLKRPKNEELIKLLKLALEKGKEYDLLNIHVAVGYIRGFFELAYISEYEQDLSIKILKRIYKSTK